MNPGERLDRVRTSTPIDRVAARVTSRGIAFTSRKKIVQRHWSAPPPEMTAPPKWCGTSAPIVIGERFGRFTVVGWFDDPARSKNAVPVWVVRCACGDYETRTSKAVRNPANANDRCEECRHLLFLKRVAYRSAHGVWPESSLMDDLV